MSPHRKMNTKFNPDGIADTIQMVVLSSPTNFLKRSTTYNFPCHILQSGTIPSPIPSTALTPNTQILS